jgi:prepilin signal peptidase PulO-like enzyme (type II secretory pathway)
VGKLMSVISIFCVSIIAGWLINVAADTLPLRRPLRETWRLPLWLLPVALHRTLKITLPERSLTKTGVPVARGRYGAIFTATLALGLLAALQTSSLLDWTILATQAWFFLTVAVIDLEHRLVLNRMLLSALPFALLYNVLQYGPNLTSTLLGGAAGFGFFLLLAILAPGAMGMGDVKLAGFIGLITGLSGVVAALFLGILAGGLAGLVVLVRNRFRRGSTLAYAPYLVVGVWFFLFNIVEMLHMYLERL